MRSLRLPLAVMVLLLGVDQASKVWVRLEVPLHHGRNLVPHLLDLTHVENRGVSFSVLGDVSEAWRVPLLVGISIVAMIMLTLYWVRHRRGMNAWSEAAFWFILPGALGNLIDRLAYGTVTDFFHFRFYATSFFVNNLADIFISIGVVAFLIGSLSHGPRATEEPEA